MCYFVTQRRFIMKIYGNGTSYFQARTWNIIVYHHSDLLIQQNFKKNFQPVLSVSGSSIGTASASGVSKKQKTNEKLGSPALVYGKLNIVLYSLFLCLFF